MDSFEINKILGAVLATCLVLLSLNIAAGALFTPHKPDKPGYNIVVPERQIEGVKPEPEKPIAELLASADVNRGERAAKACTGCHSFQKGVISPTGPNLWGVVNRPKASVPGFNYSSAMKNQKGNWTIDDLNTYLQNPKGMVPNTAMNFQGIRKGTERADVIAYLNSRSDNPAPLPKAAEAPAGPNAQAPTANAPSAPRPNTAAPPSGSAAPRPH